MILCHFATFSRTKILTWCPSARCCFLLFLSFRKSLKKKSSEKSQKILEDLTLRVESRSQKETERQATRWALSLGPWLEACPWDPPAVSARVPLTTPLRLYTAPDAKTTGTDPFSPISRLSRRRRGIQSGAYSSTLSEVGIDVGCFYTSLVVSTMMREQSHLGQRVHGSS